MSLPAAKAAMRQAARGRLVGLDGVAAGHALAAHVLAGLDLPAGAIIAGIWPLAWEIDLRPLLVALFDRGHGIVLPETPPIGQALVFRQWHPGARMIPERFGTFRPDGPVMVPDVVFVPLLAFDGAGHRLGYGGGYYDRTLAALPDRLAVGTAFAAQQVDRVPVEPHDRRLDAIATDGGILRSPAP